MHEDPRGTISPSELAKTGPAGLVATLRGVLQRRDGTTPLEDPNALVVHALRVLERHGIDGEAFVRYGMGPTLVWPALGAVAVSAILEHDKVEYKSHIDVAGWKAALGSPTITLDDSIELDWFGTSTSLLTAWALSAPFKDVLALKPPEAKHLHSLPALTQADHDLTVRYRWLVERSSGTELEAWHAAELHLEYMWADGKLEAPVPASLMAARTVDHDHLCRLIAEHAVYNPLDEEAAGWRRLLSRMQEQARTFLKQRRYVEAAALFEYLLTQRPGDPQAANNLGFCLIPVDSTRAAACFREAHNGGFEVGSLLLYNRLCAAQDDDELGDLIHTADRHWVSTLEESPEPALVWKRTSDGTWTEFDTRDVRGELARLALEVAESLGRFDRVATWRERGASFLTAGE
ncbi:hypothetical protein CLV28_0066 [Sediminihabitans luteus]|uniref:Tetratricopeptide repeat protein n=1 Tax=Sediminihabitans luteus TaxID=1138585 RepID=A0A2M9CYP1_9CELL|nr:tetratricopeptide repeat protein [Sediminihabitans luteus]PJJ76858.1 hypothetical protein CLV28_0066 [Sediminihabitans luteus]GIJ00338.1 hypothetical protein Slu03_27150 [Sediminihabitans luteus]